MVNSRTLAIVGFTVLLRQKKEVDDARAAQEKARAANKATFRP